MNEADQVRDLMAPPTGLQVYAISKAVNNVKNNGPELLEPVPADRAVGESR